MLRNTSIKYSQITILPTLIRELEIYKTARLDIKNLGMVENTIIMNDKLDKETVITYPSWFTNEQGRGMVVTSTSGNLRLKLGSVQDGNLEIRLRGMDVRDEDGIRLPVMIQFNKFAVNGTVIFDTPRNIWHDRPFAWSMPVQDGDIIEIEVEWEPAK